MNAKRVVHGDGPPEKLAQFFHLQEEVEACVKCARMSCSQRVLNLASGPITARVMFIGEAPGRLGADSSGIPFHGDKAGNNFEAFLDQVNISRYDCFITNSVLCNPKDDVGNNSSPTATEIANCSTYLRRQIDLINPPLVVTLGARALTALSLIDAHSLSLKDHVRTLNRWYGRKLIPLYHPGQRALIHRSFHNQLADYQFVAESLRRSFGAQKAKRSNALPKASACEVIGEILRVQPKVGYFQLHKLFYLIEYHCVRRTGRRLTESYIIRQKDGPYVTDLHLSKLRRMFPTLRITTERGKIFLELAPMELFSPNVGIRSSISKEHSEIIKQTVGENGLLDEASIKSKVYMTTPMRRLLRAERSQRANTFNRPIDFSGV